MPRHSREANKYPKHKTYNKNRTIGTDTSEIYDAASLLNIILYNSREFHSVWKPVGLGEKVLCTLHKKEIPRGKEIASFRADDNVAYIRKGITKRIF